MHSVDVEDVGMPSRLPAEVQFVDCVINACFSLGRKIQSRRRQLQLHQFTLTCAPVKRRQMTWFKTEEPRQPPRIIRFSDCPIIRCS